MRLVKFRIENYKSIIDSGWCYLASDLTILAGKNESGKSATLEALRDCHKPKFDKTSNPLSKTATQCVHLVYKIEDGDTALLANEILNKYFDELKEIGISHYADGRIELSEDTSAIIENTIFPPLKEEIENLITCEIITGDLSKIDINKIKGWSELIKRYDLSAIKKSIASYFKNLEERVNSATDPTVIDSLKIQKEQITDGQNTLIELYNIKNNIIELIKENVPQFIFFSSFDDILPFEIKLDAAKENNSVTDFCNAANIDIDLVIASKSDKQFRDDYLDEKSATISGNFKKYWKQNAIEMHARIDGDDIVFKIKDEGKTTGFPAKQKSKGFQWFLSFYMRLNSSVSNKRVILIDEPGLYLHAQAQNDVLSVLEDLSLHSQIIFSTHSPYLIHADRLDRIRLINKGEKGTVIHENRKHSLNEETLTPIITAIGLGIGNELSIAKLCNLIVEGISDYYYLHAADLSIGKNYLESINIIPCIGCQKIPSITSILIGWGLHFAILLDGDKEGESIKKKMMEEMCIDENKIITVKEDSTIEDLFSDKDKTNFMPHKKTGKHLLSKILYERIREKEIVLEKETLTNFEKVLVKIRSQFKDLVQRQPNKLTS